MGSIRYIKFSNYLISNYHHSGVGLGALTPLIPVVAAMAMKKELVGRTAYFVGGSSALLFAGTFIQSYLRNEDEE